MLLRLAVSSVTHIQILFTVCFSNSDMPASQTGINLFSANSVIYLVAESRERQQQETTGVSKPDKKS